MEHQVGGHPMLSFGSEYIIKVLPKDDRGFREVLFYEALRTLVDQEASGKIVKSDIANLVLSRDLGIQQRNARLLRALAPFTAKYYGTTTSGASIVDVDDRPTGMILSNITAGFQKPCVLDIKMGQNTYEPDATLEKKESQQQKYPEQQIFGFRVIGMKVYDPSNTGSDQNGFLAFDKDFGRQLKSAEDIQNALSTYFKLRIDGDSECSVAMIQHIIRHLERLRKVLAELNYGMGFIASSILIVYEGDEALCAPEKCTVKMIDFAHVRYNRGGDLSLIYGLDTIITMLRSIL
jgi:1D-myo-inositol-tetrakisphosphate 5-kinase/inositol-polyphosphate multikinase